MIALILAATVAASPQPAPKSAVTTDGNSAVGKTEPKAQATQQQVPVVGFLNPCFLNKAHELETKCPDGFVPDKIVAEDPQTKGGIVLCTCKKFLPVKL